MDHIKISEWAQSDRPREKLLNSGSASLSEAELIAILLRSGTREMTALDLARNVLSGHQNDLSILSRVSVKDLSKFKGLGPVKAITILAALELGKRRREAIQKDKPSVTCSNDAVELIRPHLADLNHEEFWILLLNRANKVTDKKMISKGGVSGTVVDPKIIFRYALEGRASAIVLSHNHPSGNLKPSDSDIQLTKKLKDAGKSLEISVLDHIIIAGESYYSFADEGML